MILTLMTYELDTLRVTLQNIYVKVTNTHTQQTDCITWTTWWSVKTEMMTRANRFTSSIYWTILVDALIMY